ncbi:MAG: hypothetical protein P4L82_12230 [Ancalomicrobiaceae bacterium]|nr:hypothetical protein [Ancalomicrobiaceae bacterium]
MTYSLPGGSNISGVIRDVDGASIPADPANADWRAYQAWLGEGNAPAPYVTPSPDITAEARSALTASDMTVLRCVEAGVAVPAEWVAYRRALRAIVAGGSAALPARPAYPAGT